MCLILFAHESHPHYRLIIAANRDEYYLRPSLQASYWEDYANVLAGRDLEQNGTWLGITKTGRYAAVTNYRNPSLAREDVKSRGQLVSSYLCGKSRPKAYLSGVDEAEDEYNGYNILVGDAESLYYYSNIEREQKKISPGVYGLSNHLLNTPWPKVEKGKKALAKYLQSRNVGVADSLFEILSDNGVAADDALPHTGVSIKLERMLSPIFIKGDTYGTRSSTVILADRKNHVQLIERSFFQHHEGWAEAAYEFDIG